MSIGYQKPNHELALLCFAIAYAAFRRLGDTEDCGGDVVVAGWEFDRWNITNTEQILGIKARTRADIAVDCLIDFWHHAGHRMRARSVRTDFGRLLGQPDRVEVDWREIRP